MATEKHRKRCLPLAVEGWSLGWGVVKDLLNLILDFRGELGNELESLHVVFNLSRLTTV